MRKINFLILFSILALTACDGSDVPSQYGSLSLADTSWKLLGARCVVGHKATPYDQVKYQKSLIFFKDEFSVDYNLGTCGNFSGNGKIHYHGKDSGLTFTPKTHNGMNKAIEACGLKVPHKMEIDEHSTYGVDRHEMVVTYPPNKNRDNCTGGTLEEFYEKKNLNFDSSLETCQGINDDVTGYLTQKMGPTYVFSYGGKKYSSTFVNAKTQGNNIELSAEEILSTWTNSETGTPINRVKRTLTLRTPNGGHVLSAKVMCTVKNKF